MTTSGDYNAALQAALKAVADASYMAYEISEDLGTKMSRNSESVRTWAKRFARLDSMLDELQRMEHTNEPNGEYTI